MNIERRRQLIIIASDLGFAAAEQDRAKAFLGNSSLGFDIDDAEENVPVTDEAVTMPRVAAVIRLYEEVPARCAQSAAGLALSSLASLVRGIVPL